MSREMMAKCVLDADGNPCLDTFDETEEGALKKWSPYTKSKCGLPEGYRIATIRFEDISKR